MRHNCLYCKETFRYKGTLNYHTKKEHRYALKIEKEIVLK